MLTFWQAVTVLTADFISTTVRICFTLSHRLADAILTALEGRAIRVRFAGSKARTVKTDLIIETVTVGTTDWCTDSIGTFGRCRAEGCVCAVKDDQAAKEWISTMSRQARADSLMVKWGTVGILTANISDFARIDALVIEACLSGGAVVLLRTFELFTFSQRVSRGADRAGAECAMSYGITFCILTTSVFTSVLTFTASTDS